jgi:hypothetical protein
VGGVQFHGSNSCRQLCGMSAMRAKTSASHAFRFDVIETRRHDERRHHGGPLGTAIRAGEQPCLSP